MGVRSLDGSISGVGLDSAPRAAVPAELGGDVGAGPQICVKGEGSLSRLMPIGCVAAPEGSPGPVEEAGTLLAANLSFAAAGGTMVAEDGLVDSRLRAMVCSALPFCKVACYC